MDYLETINDPLKYYFKEKIGNLYINKDVMKVFIEKGNKGEGQSVVMLTESFMNFSEIEDLQKTKARKEPSRIIDRMSFKKKLGARPTNPVESYEQEKLKKKTNAIMMNKVNDVVAKDRTVSYIDSDFGRFVDNDQLVRLNLDTQNSMIQTRLFARKQKSFIKGGFRSNFRAIIPKCINK